MVKNVLLFLSLLTVTVIYTSCASTGSKSTGTWKSPAIEFKSAKTTFR
ncbi:MAG: hypothetical protein KAQ98_11405 [Bacteriovoracaceae bacterium]|nr:hypothetical protein [Bacteriovoracaceae bacterium]